MVFFIFCEISFSLQKKKIFEKKQKHKKQRKIGPSFDSKKGYFWTKFWLYSMCSIMGCFFPMRSRMLPPDNAFENGVCSVWWQKALFLQCFVGLRSATIIARSARNMRRRLGVTCWKWGMLQTQFRCFTCGWVQVGVRLAFVSGVRTCPELRGTWGFQVSDLEMATGSSKTRVIIDFLGRAHPQFCVFWCRASILQKRVFENRPISLKPL